MKHTIQRTCKLLPPIFPTNYQIIFLGLFSQKHIFIHIIFLYVIPFILYSTFSLFITQCDIIFAIGMYFTFWQYSSDEEKGHILRFWTKSDENEELNVK